MRVVEQTAYVCPFTGGKENKSLMNGSVSLTISDLAVRVDDAVGLLGGEIIDGGLVRGRGGLRLGHDGDGPCIRPGCRRRRGRRR